MVGQKDRGGTLGLSGRGMEKGGLRMAMPGKDKDQALEVQDRETVNM